MEKDKDERLWRIAKKRVGFRNHLLTYLVINIFLWLMWYFTDYSKSEGWSGIPWPIFCTLGWGIGLFFSFLGAYVTFDKEDQVEREYEKLKNR